MVSKAVKGVGDNKLIPITSLMSIELKDGVMTIITTDGINYLYVKDKSVYGEDFYVTVSAEKFAKLVARTTSDTITLELMPNGLHFVGNGSYMLDLPVDEDGSFIKYPDPYASFVGGDGKVVKMATILTILETVKPSLAVTLEMPCYTGYYIGEKVVATDTFKIASMDTKLLDEPVLISPDTLNLLAIVDKEEVTVYRQDNVIIFYTDNCVVYSNVMEGIGDYAIDAINGLVDTEFKSVCKISKASILQVLDRIALFIGAYDKNGIRLTFKEDHLQIESKATTGVETIDYEESENFEHFTCLIDIEMLASQIKSQATDVVELYYGLHNAVKMKDGNITQIIALLEDV